MSAITEKISDIGSPIAEAAISAKQGYGVKAGTAAHTVDVAGSGDVVRGVILDNGSIAIGEPVQVAHRPGDLVMAIAGGSFNPGDKVNTDSAGKFIKVTAVGAAFYGYAETAGVSAKMFALRIMPGIINVAEFAQGTTGTSGTAGQIAVAGMTSAAVVIATLAEDPGTNLVLSDVVAGTGLFTVYTKDVTGTPTRAALSGKKVNYLVLSL